MSGCCRLSKAAAVVHSKASVSKAAAVLHAKAPVQVLIQLEPYGLAPYAGLLSPEDPLTISPGCQYPLLLGSRSPLNCVSLPHPSFLPSRLIWPRQVQKCLEAQAMLPFVCAYTMDSVAWRPWQWSGLPQFIGSFCSHMFWNNPTSRSSFGATSGYSHFSSMDSLGKQNVPWYFGQFVLEQIGCIYSVSGQSGI